MLTGHAPEGKPEAVRTALPLVSVVSIAAGTVDELDRAQGTLATAALNRMDERLPWFRALDPDDRSWIGLIAQTGIAGFVRWLRRPGDNPMDEAPANIFGIAPRQLTRVISLQQTVELIRACIDVVEEGIDSIVAVGDRPQVLEQVLRFSREVAFAAAGVYAQTAELRGAWDARLEALVVDAVLRGETDEAQGSRAAALGWDTTGRVVVVIGYAPHEVDARLVDILRHRAVGAGLDLLASVQGDRVVAVLGGVDDAEKAAVLVADSCGDGPVVYGQLVDDLPAAAASARAALAGLRAASGWPSAPRPVSADDLLPERALSGDGHARRQLVNEVYLPLAAGSPVLLDTATAFVESGGSVEATARELFVHANTVRYRLRQIAELTGRSPTDARDAYVMRIGLTLGRLLRS